MRLKLPDPAARPAVAAFALVWIGVVCGRSGWWAALLIAGGILLVPRPWRRSWALVSAALVAGALAGFLAFERDRAVLAAELPTGSHSVLVIVATDPRSSRFGGAWFLARPVALRAAASPGAEWLAWQGPPVVVDLPDRLQGLSDPVLQLGQRLEVTGIIRPSPGRVGSMAFAGTISVNGFEAVTADINPLLWAGNSLRARVVGYLDGRGPSAALVSGFLVGAIDDLPAADVDALRSAGISHYVAVSGANVAAFLLLWFIILGPLGVGARRRGVFGLIAVLVFAVATRWEPSVVRASMMAGLVLLGRVCGVPVNSWTALGWSGALALVVAPDLTQSLGFQLSVLATVGLMSGGDLLPDSAPSWLRRSLGPTLAAQCAVTPLLLSAFGSVPVVSPLSNLIAAPLVSSATLLGGLGTLTGFEPFVAMAIDLAGLILDLAHLAAGFPQVGLVGLVPVVAAGFAARSSRLRSALALAVALALVGGGIGRAVVVAPAVVFLDVGQGDASLILGTDGITVLVDAGPDPPVLASALRRYGVDRIHLLVVTHPHEDHIAGVVGLVGRISIDRVWTWGGFHTSESWELVSEQLAGLGVAIEAPAIGTTAIYGGVEIEVLGPLRRYAGINDQSVVLRVDAGATSVLMTGDIEMIAQANLGPITTDVLKVPHHGGATSSLSWLAATKPMVAVISVGPNDYGHPAPEVMEVLGSVGAIVLRTDQAGDVVVPLTGDPLRRLQVVASGPVPERGRG